MPPLLPSKGSSGTAFDPSGKRAAVHPSRSVGCSGQRDAVHPSRCRRCPGKREAVHPARLPPSDMRRLRGW
eukprot:1232372-Heterocapsa_arctica.AAC.1